MAQKQGVSVAEIVYGKQHVEKYHKSKVYKPKYLKTLKNGRMYGFPDGLPGFSTGQKIHLMGHSMGGLTARHFQYMLESGELSRFEDQVPGPNFVKSITFFAGAINGSLAPSNHGGNWCKNERKIKFNKFGKWIFSLKMCIFGQNFFVS